MILRETALLASSYYKDIISIVLFTCDFASLLFSIFVLSLFDSLFGLIEVVKQVKKYRKVLGQRQKNETRPMKKTKAEFAESKKDNLADSEKESFEQIELPVATTFSVLFPRIFFLAFPFLSYAQVQKREHT